MKIMEGKVALVNGAATSITDLYMRFICWLILLSTVSSAGFSQENQQYDPTDQAALHMLPVNSANLLEQPQYGLFGQTHEGGRGFCKFSRYMVEGKGNDDQITHVYARVYF